MNLSTIWWVPARDTSGVRIVDVSGHQVPFVVESELRKVFIPPHHFYEHQRTHHRHSSTLFLAAALFLHYSIQRNLISPEVRVAIGSWLARCASSWVTGLRRRTPMVGFALSGAGIAILYAALFAPQRSPSFRVLLAASAVRDTPTPRRTRAHPAEPRPVVWEDVVAAVVPRPRLPGGVSSGDGATGGTKCCRRRSTRVWRSRASIS